LPNSRFAAVFRLFAAHAVRHRRLDLFLKVLCRIIISSAPRNIGGLTDFFMTR